MRALPWIVLCLPFWTACESNQAQRRSPAETANEPVRMEEQVEALERISQPGKAHARLASLAGEFRMESARVAADGTETRTPLEGLARLEWILGSRYLRWDSQARVDGREFTTHGWVGYDNRLEEYQLSMITSVSSGMAIWHGAGNPLAEGITFTMEQFDPRSGSRLRARNRLRVVSQDVFVTEDLDAEERALQRTYYRRITR